MKNGFSDGVNAGRNNGVVDQRLSRFATEAERKCAGSNCEGNTNWLNHRKVHFNTPESADTQFWVNRPAFKSGTVDDSQRDADPLPDNIRGGLGNRDITRNNFLASEIKPRFTGDFDKLQALDIAEIGAPTTITENKLGYFTQIKIPDPTDFNWLREKARLEAEITTRFTNAGFPANEIPAMVGRELEINKPLGREQRTINKNSNDISRESKLNTSQKLREIIQEVQQGRAEGNINQVRLTAQLGLVLNNVNDISRITRRELTDLGITLTQLGFPVEYKKVGFGARFVDNVFYNANSGLINLFLLARVRYDRSAPTQYNYQNPVRNFAPNRSGVVSANGLPAITLPTMTTALGRSVNPLIGSSTKRYLDLERGGVISQDQLIAFAAADPLGGYAGANFAITNPPP